MKVEINHLTKVIQGNVVLDDINACFSCASGENGGRIYGIQGINGNDISFHIGQAACLSG